MHHHLKTNNMTVKQILETIEQSHQPVKVLLSLSDQQAIAVTGFLIKHPEKDVFRVSPFNDEDDSRNVDFFAYFTSDDVDCISANSKNPNNPVKYLIEVKFNPKPKSDRLERFYDYCAN